MLLSYQKQRGQRRLLTFSLESTVFRRTWWLTRYPTTLSSALQRQDVAIPAAIIHNDLVDVEFDVGLLEGIAFKIVWTSGGLVNVNRIGRSVQLSASEHSSDCLEDRYCVKTVHSTAAPADPVTGLTSTSRCLHMVGLEILFDRHSTDGEFGRIDAVAFGAATIALVSSFAATPLDRLLHLV